MPFDPPYIDARITDYRAEVLSPVVYKGKKDTFTINKGFVTDFASVPQLAQWLVPRIGPAITMAALVHDYLYSVLRGECPPLDPPISVVDADGIFRRILKEEGASFVTRWIAWAGVRWGALGESWRRKDWWSTFPKLMLVTLAVVLPIILLIGVIS